MAVKLQSLLTRLGRLKAYIARVGYRYRYFMYPILLITGLSTITAILAYSSIGQSLYHSTSHEVINSKINFLLDETTLTIGLLSALVLGLSAYLIIDYRQHKKPLKSELPSVQYGLFHHIKMVSLPLLRYHWRPLSYSVAMGTTSFVVMAITLLLVAPHIFAFSGSGSGTTNDPYQISTCAQLEEMESDNSYILIHDIDCSDTVNWNGGAGFLPLFWSSGTQDYFHLDGHGYAVKGLYTQDDGGLIQFLNAHSSIKNLSLTNSTATASISAINNDVNSYPRVGALVNMNLGLIENVHSDLNVAGSSHVGGFAVGGLVGFNGGTITKSSSTGDVTAVGAGISDTAYVGGLVGRVSMASPNAITDSFSSGSVTSTSGPSLQYCGGFIGESGEGNIARSYSSGSVDCPSASTNGTGIGGFIGNVGSSYSTTVTDSFTVSSASFSGPDVGGVGGFVGHNDIGVQDVLVLTNDYYDSSRTGQTICTYDTPTKCDSVNVGNAQPDYFKNNSTDTPLSNWDFVNIWKTNPGSYPTFRQTTTVTTQAATGITETAATLHGTLVAPGVDTTQRGFEYGTSTSYGSTFDEPATNYSEVSDWGSSGTGDGQFNTPGFITHDQSNNIYVTDFGNHRIQKFDSNGNYLSQWGSYGTGNGQFINMDGIGIDSTGKIYVADDGSSRIEIFDSSGNYLSQIGPLSHINSLYLDENDHIFVGRYPTFTFTELDTSGTVLNQFGQSGTGNGEFGGATALTTDQSGNIYVADSANHRVQKFDSGGTYLSQWGSLGTGNGQFTTGATITADSTGVYVVDTGLKRVQKFDFSGNYVSQFMSSDGGGVTMFGITRTSEGDIYIPDYSNNVVRKFSIVYPAGAFSTTLNSLACSTTYHYRAYATNPEGTGYGEDQTFDTDTCSAPSCTASCPFVTTWKTDNPGIDGPNEITIPTTGGGYNYDVDWGDGNTSSGQTGDANHLYSSAGTYTVSITGAFPRIYFNGIAGLSQNSDYLKILTVEQWGTNQWTSMSHAFSHAFNMTITATDSPDLSNVTDTSEMLWGTAISQSLDQWDVSHVTTMADMFGDTIYFNQPLNSWDVSHVTNMSDLFEMSAFNQPLDQWDVSSVVDMTSMFSSALYFNQSLNSWDVSHVTTMHGMFSNASSFNQPLDQWDVSSVVDMRSMFNQAAVFNQPIGGWDVSSVVDMADIFYDAFDFNQPLNSWDVSNVINMLGVFDTATSFNQPLDQWDVSSVENMWDMFLFADSFNQPLNSWDVSNVTTMNSMFGSNAAFNQPLDQWDVSSVTDMNGMFAYGIFDQSLGDWDVTAVTRMQFMFLNAGLSTINYDATLIGWSGESLQSNVVFDAGTSTYCNAASQRLYIISFFSWTVNDSGEDCPPPISDQTDFRLTQTLTSTGSIVSGDNVTYHFKITNEGPVNSEFIGEMIAVLPTEFTYASNTNESQVTCTDYGLADNIPSPYWPALFTGHHVLDCTNAVSNILINTGQSIEFDVIGSATANFAANSTVSKAMYLDVLHETADAGILFTAIGSNIDFSTLTINNVSKAIYTYSSGGGGGVTTPPPVTSKPKPKPTTPKTPPSTSILSPPSASSESAGGPQESVLKDQINNFAVSKRSGFLQRFSDTAAISINWLLLLILLIIAGLYSWRARKEYLARERLESALSRLRGTKQALDTYLSITTHYLNTPVAIMNGAIELLASLRKLPEWAILNLQSKLKKYAADVTQLGTAAQLVTAGSDTHDLPTSSVTMIGTVSRKPSLIKQRAVWIPVGIVTALIALVTFLFTHAHVYILSPVQTGLQILCLILAAGLIAFAHHNRDVQLTAQAVAQASLTTEQQLVNQRTTFMSQASAVLADDYENLSIASKDFHIIPETKTFYNGLGMLGASVSSLTKVTQLTNLSSDYPLLNLKQEVTRTLSELQPQTEAKHLQLQVAIPEDLQVSTQPEQIKQLVQSVVDNAIKFNKDGGIVRISAHQARKQVVLRVTDSGIGIPAERLPHMFEPFFRATDTETYDYQGLGLSLYTDKLIVEQLGGKIELSSSPTGTNVQIALPTGRKAANAVPTLVTPTVQAE